VAQGQKIDLVHFSSGGGLGCPGKRDVAFGFRSFWSFGGGSRGSARLLGWRGRRSDASDGGRAVGALVGAQGGVHFSLFCGLIGEMGTW